MDQGQRLEDLEPSFSAGRTLAGNLKDIDDLCHTYLGQMDKFSEYDQYSATSTDATHQDATFSGAREKHRRIPNYQLLDVTEWQGEDVEEWATEVLVKQQHQFGECYDLWRLRTISGKDLLNLYSRDLSGLVGDPWGAVLHHHLQVFNQFPRSSQGKCSFPTSAGLSSSDYESSASNTQNDSKNWELSDLETSYNWNTSESLCNPGSAGAVIWNSPEPHTSQPGDWNSAAFKSMDGCAAPESTSYSSCNWMNESLPRSKISVNTGSYLQNSGYWEAESFHGARDWTACNQFQKSESHPPCEPVSLSLDDCNPDLIYASTNYLPPASSSLINLDSWKRDLGANCCYSSDGWENESKTSLNLTEPTPGPLDWAYSNFQQNLESEKEASMFHHIPKECQKVTKDPGTVRKPPAKRRRGRKPGEGCDSLLGDLRCLDFLEQQSLAGDEVMRGQESDGNHSNITLPMFDILKKIPSKNRKRERGPRIWEFLIRLLMDKRSNPSLIRWEEEATATFRLMQPDIVAQLWSKRAPEKPEKATSSYNNFARGLRYHYGTGALVAVSERQLVYRCGPEALRYLQELKEAL